MNWPHETGVALRCEETHRSGEAPAASERLPADAPASVRQNLEERLPCGCERPPIDHISAPLFVPAGEKSRQTAMLMTLPACVSRAEPSVAELELGASISLLLSLPRQSLKEFL